MIGYVGLGNLGRAMAGRLEAVGETLTVWNRTPGRCDGLKAAVAETPAELMNRSQTVIVCLFDSAAVEQVFTAPDGLLAGECRGKLIIDTTTNDFRRVGAFHALCGKAGARYLESPVLGSVVPASQGKLTVVISGERSDYEEARPLFEKLGENLFYLGAPGRATRMKLVNNLVLGAFMATLAEALAAAEAAGLTKSEALDILAAGAGNSLVLNAKRLKLAEEDYAPHFSINAVHKDLGLMAALAETTGSRAAMATAAERLFGEASSRGLGDRDLAAIYAVLKNGR